MNSQTNQDPFEYYPCSVASPSISLVSFLCPAILASHLLQFARLASRKTVLQKNNHSTQRALHTRVVWGFMFKFHQELSFASTDWLSYLSELSVRHLFVAVLFAKQEIFLSLFPQQIFFTSSRHFEELQLIGKLYDYRHIWTVPSLTFTQQLCLQIVCFYIDFLCSQPMHFINKSLVNKTDPCQNIFTSFALSAFEIEKQMTNSQPKQLITHTLWE